MNTLVSKAEEALPPRIFVVSSKESGKIRDVLVEKLKDLAVMVPWNRDDLWLPGKFILQVLLDVPHTYDFAIAVYGADDKVHYRHEKVNQARDNVIFETGMFMAHLGYERTFVIVPEEPKVRVLTDLSGLMTLSYKKPGEVTGISGSLEPVCEKIRSHVANLGRRRGTVGVGPMGYLDGHQAVLKELDVTAKEYKGRQTVTVTNIALDMEFTLGFLRDGLLGDPERSDISWRSLMIDGSSRSIKKLSSNEISAGTAKRQEINLANYLDEVSGNLKDRKITFECRAYSDVPLLHGFMINKDVLFLNMCSLPDERLSSAKSFLVFRTEPKNEVANDYISVFATWFDHIWASARSVWPKPG